MPAIAGIRAALVVGALSLSPGLAQAGSCSQWQAPGTFYAFQDNGPNVTFSVRQKGQRVYGQAGYATNRRIIKGRVNGGISGDQLFLRVYWTDSGLTSIGQYAGRISPQGLMTEGSTIDELAQAPMSVRWKTQMAFGCPDRNPVIR